MVTLQHIRHTMGLTLAGMLVEFFYEFIIVFYTIPLTINLTKCCVLFRRYSSSYVNAYGAEGYHNYMRNQDPTYDQFYQDGPSLDDKWRSTYPYVPTSYLHQTQGK